MGSIKAARVIFKGYAALIRRAPSRANGLSSRERPFRRTIVFVRRTFPTNVAIDSARLVIVARNWPRSAGEGSRCTCAAFARSVKGSFPPAFLPDAEVDIFDASGNLRIVREEYALYPSRIHPGTNLRPYIRIPRLSVYARRLCAYMCATLPPHVYTRARAVYTKNGVQSFRSSMQNRFCRLASTALFNSDRSR